MPQVVTRERPSSAGPLRALELGAGTAVAERPAAARSRRRGVPLLAMTHRYSAAALRADSIAGLTAALFSVPQSMAYAMIAGVPPAAGVATAAVASIAGALFGSSAFLINGPTNALAVMLAGSATLVGAHGDPLNMVIVLTLLVGAIQLLAGVLRAGSLTRFVSEPVMTGFTAGAGVYIVINQLPALLGLERADIRRDLFGLHLPSSAVFELLRVVQSFNGVRPVTLGLALLTFTLLRQLQRAERRLGARLPAAFLSIAAVTLIVWIFGLDQGNPLLRVRVVRDIAPLHRNLLALHFPSIEPASLQGLLGPACALAMMGAVEAIAIGKSLAARAGHAFDASRQLLGEGMCNLGAALVGGFASSGSFTRSAVNFEAGAVTRLSCVFAGVLTLLLVLAFAPAANLIPVAALAGTLVHIGTRLVDVARLRAVYATTVGDRVVLLITFAAVLFAEHLEHALMLGVAASIYNALRRAEGFKLNLLAEGDDGSLREPSGEDAATDTEVAVLNLQGELFFAAAEELQAELTRLLDEHARFIVLRVHEAYNMDATVASAIAQVAHKARKQGGRLLLCGVRPGMYGTFERGGLLAEIGADAVFPAEAEVLASTRHAVRYAHALAAAAKASRASLRVDHSAGVTS